MVLGKRGMAVEKKGMASHHAKSGSDPFHTCR